MNLSEAILYIGLAQSIFAAFALATRNHVSLPDKLLIGGLLVFALKFIILILHTEHSEFFDMQFSLGLIPLTFGPILYLYTSYLVADRKRFRPLDLLHFLPFVVITFLYFILFQDRVDFSDETYLRPDRYLWVRVTFGIVFFASVIVYTALTFVKLINFRKTIEAQFSYRDARVRLFWLNFIAILFSLSGLVVVVAGTYNAIQFRKVVDTSLLSHIGLTTVAYCISYFGLRQASLFRVQYTVHEQEDAESNSVEGHERGAKPRFTEKDAELLTARLLLHMNEERPYLNPELTLGELSAQ
ncbi:MAG: hypothetical protein EP314_00545, partial [Bacteroidetes bacterium]